MVHIKNIAILGIILAAIVSRFIPHPPNFTPMLALCLFFGSVVRNKKISFAVPIIIMIVTDYFLGFHNILLWVYISMILIVLLGMNLINKIKTIPIILGVSLSSLLFYLVTNFGVWMGSNLYPKTLSGLLLCYSAGIPFLQNTIASNFFFSCIFFGTYMLLSEKSFKLQTRNNNN